VAAVQAQAAALPTLTTAQEFPLWMGVGICWQGWVLTMQGQSVEGLVQLRQGLAVVLATGQELSRPFCLLLLAEAAGHAGQVDEGLRLMTEALTVRAEACFQQALAVARSQQARSWELRAASSLASLWQQ
jgi:hypothetical protein